MVEIVGGVAAHPEALHHGARANVSQCRERHDLLKAQRLEGEHQGCARCLGREALTPGLAGESPANLDGRLERGLERRARQAGEPDESPVLEALEGPEPEPVARPLRLGRVGESIAGGTVSDAAQELGDIRVGVERCERLAVARQPATKEESLRTELGDGHRAIVARSPVAKGRRPEASVSFAA